MQYLASVRGVSATDEVLNHALSIGLRRRLLTRRGRLRHLQRSLSVLPGPITAAKITFTHLAQQGLTIDDLAAIRPEPTLVVLYRRSLAESFVSLQVATMTGHWESRSDASPFEGTVSVDPEEFRSYAAGIRAEYDSVLQSEWARRRAVAVAYEDLVHDPQRVFDDLVLPAIGLPSSPVSAHLRKQLTRPLDALVENYGDVETLFVSDEAVLVCDLDHPRAAS
jgi:hypothetical protein